jgi:hypothetical protein
MKTIAKNRTAKVEEIFRNATTCMAYDKENKYTAEACDKSWALNELRTFHFARLIDMEDGTYKVKVHSCCWYKLS